MSGVAPIAQAQAGRVATVASVTNIKLDSAKPAAAAVELRSRTSQPQPKAKVTSKSAFDVKPQVKPGFKDTRGPRGTAGVKRTAENLVEDFGAAAPTSAVSIAPNATLDAQATTPTNSPSFSISSPIIPTTPITAPTPLPLPTIAECNAKLAALARAVIKEKANEKEAVATDKVCHAYEPWGYKLHGVGEEEKEERRRRRGEKRGGQERRKGKRSVVAEMLDREREEGARREKEEAEVKARKKIQQKKGMQGVRVKFVDGAWVVGA